MDDEYPSFEWFWNRWISLAPEARDREFLRVQELEPILGVGEDRIHHLIQEGRLPDFKILGRLRIHFPTLDAAMKKHGGKLPSFRSRHRRSKRQKPPE